jgi:DNA-directed RNA polymerase specialized sigma subunit
MTAKEYLNQYSRLDGNILANNAELKRLRELSQSPPSVNLSREKVSGGNISDRVGGFVSQIVDFEREIEEENLSFIKKKQEIRERINSIYDEELKLVLKLHYLNSLNLSRIAEDMSYSYRHVFRIHKNAIDTFQKKYGDDF